MLALLVFAATKLDAQGAERQLRIAVVDTGLNVDDPRFVICNNLMKVGPPREGDDVPSKAAYDFVNNHAYPVDMHGHGTHIAGIITALTERKACLIVCKFYSDRQSGKQQMTNTVNCLDFARLQKADMVNYSGGGPEYVPAERDAVQRLAEAGIQLVAAAGNEHQNIDVIENKYYPAGYLLTNETVVGSIAAPDTNPEVRSPTSNFGRTVTAWAPGDDLFSSLPGKGHTGVMSGTSQATAVCTGRLARQRLGLPPIVNQAVRGFLLHAWTR